MLQGWCLQWGKGCVVSIAAGWLQCGLIWYRVFLFLCERDPCYKPSDLFSDLSVGLASVIVVFQGQKIILSQ